MPEVYRCCFTVEHTESFIMLINIQDEGEKIKCIRWDNMLNTLSLTCEAHSIH